MPQISKKLKEEYEDASIFLLLSSSESFAIARLEAIANGLYVISSEAGCAADFKKHDIHIVDINNIDEIIKQIELAINIVDNGKYKFNQPYILIYEDIIKSILEYLNMST